jgi:anti-sigma-K factor RskA
MTGNHPEEFRELATLAVLNALEGEEAAAFARHLEGCEVCRTTMEDDRRIFAQLDESALGMEASPGFRERLLARAAAERHTPAEPQDEDSPAVIPFPAAKPADIAGARRRTRTPWLIALAASVALALGVGAYAGQQAYANQVLVAVPLAGEQGNGTALMTVHRSGRTELQLNQLNDPPPGKVYVLWVIPPDGKPVPAGAITRGTQTIPVSQPVLGTTVAVTTEDDPGAQAPTTKPFLSAKVVA